MRQNMFFLKDLKGLRGLWHRWEAQRQRLMAKGLSALYGRPVMVAPQHVVALGGVVMLWSWPMENGRPQSGPRMLLMVRPKGGKGAGADRRARFISQLGLGKHADMPAALHHTLAQQLGPVFTRLLGADVLAPRHMVGLPILTLTDEDTGGQLPLQLMVWAAELRPHQEAALQLADNLELLWVAEDALDSPQVSPTHRQLWHAVAPMLPRFKGRRAAIVGREDGVEVLGPEEAATAAEPRKPLKVLH